MITIIVGHRGVGKSQFLLRIAQYFTNLKLPVLTYDLDQIIEQNEGLIENIFTSKGELFFRELEKKYFNNIIENTRALNASVFIAVGAGFSEDMPKNTNVWWLRRPTDKLGRIFNNRPRLNINKTPLEEYKERFFERDMRFRALSHKEIILSEGWDLISPYEPCLLGIKPADLGAAVTLMPSYFVTPFKLQFVIDEFLQLGIKYFELRDDLLSIEQIKTVIDKIPNDKVLISFRSKKTSQELILLSGPFMTDWAIELGESPLQHNSILSVHERRNDEPIEEALNRLLSFKADHYKLSVEVRDFIELWNGHKLFLESPNKISFLPRSENGRWAWYRLLQKNSMKLNFVRRGDGSSPDQPTIFDYLRTPIKPTGFAAVLGDPVIHSRTPAEHSDFFNSKNFATFAVEMKEDECNSLNLGILEKLGMKYAAVTSPLKIKFSRLCTKLDYVAESLKAVNTIEYVDHNWVGTNTDIDGLKSMFDALNLGDETVVWGGGGTRWALRSILKGARFFSARQGEEIWIENKSTPALIKPQTIVWALGRANWDKTEKPPKNWQPEYVFDLNYGEDSPGIEYALSVGAKYISGKSMFKAQAIAQQKFWSNEVKF